MKKIDWSGITLDAFGKVGQHFEFSLRNMGASIIAQHALASGSPLAEMEEEGNVEIKNDDPEGNRYLKMVEKIGGRLFHKWIGEHYRSHIFLMDQGIVTVDTNGSWLKVSGLSLDENMIRELRSTVSKDFLPKVRHGHIFSIVRSGSHLSLTSIGNAGIALEAGNYTPEVMKDYREAIKDLNTDSPSGRIVIMEGEPGTGKTHLIRAMLLEVPDAMFVLVSPEVVPSLAGPELLPLLLTNKNNYAMNGPIILVLEDADRCLVTRGDSNISSIQSLLNLGDGILGSLLDLRIVATTNAKKLEMEAAILRPGRLSKRLEVGVLDFDTALNVFRRLCPNKSIPPVFKLAWEKKSSFKMTLAEVYSLSRNHGWEPKKREIVREVEEDENKDLPDY